MKLEITDAKLRHCGQIARLLRVEHAYELMRREVPIHRELRVMFNQSFYKRAAFVDGHLCAVWGAEGSMMSSTANVWLALSQYAVKFPITVLRVARRELQHLGRFKPEIITTVIPQDEAAHRLVAFLGFESPDGFGGGPARDRSARGNMLRYIRSNPDLLVPAGPTKQIGLIYRSLWNRSG
jgi:hypothetical protein